MNNEINLLQQSTNKTASLRKLVLLRFMAISLLFIVSFFSITLFILIALSPLPSLREREKDDAQQLAAFHPAMAKVLTTKERLVHIEELLTKRLSHAESLESLRNLVPQELIVRQVNMSDKKISFTVMGPSLASFDIFTKSIVEFNRSHKEFSKATLTNVTKIEGNYTLTLDILML